MENRLKLYWISLFPLLTQYEPSSQSNVAKLSQSIVHNFFVRCQIDFKLFLIIYVICDLMGLKNELSKTFLSGLTLNAFYEKTRQEFESFLL